MAELFDLPTEIHFFFLFQLQAVQSAGQMHSNQQYAFTQPQRPQSLTIGRTQVATRPDLVSTPSTPTTMTLPSSLGGMVTQQQPFNTAGYQGTFGAFASQKKYGS